MPDGVKTTDDILAANEALNNYRVRTLHYTSNAFFSNTHLQKEHIIDIPQHISKEFSDMKNSSMLFVKKNSNATGMKDASTYFGQFATAWSQVNMLKECLLLPANKLAPDGSSIFTIF